MSEFDRTLAVALRPNRFSEVVGYESVLLRLRNQFASGRIPVAMLFKGESRGGKTTLAKILAASINCDHGDFGEPCEECLSHVDDFVIERNCGINGQVAPTRELVTQINCYPQFGKFRIILLDEAHKLTADSQSALLVAAERPDGYNIFIFCTSEPEKLTEAIQKRCAAATYDLDGFSADDVATLARRAALHVFTDEQLEVQPVEGLIDLLIDRKIFIPGDVINAVENLANGATLEEAAITPTISGKIQPGKLCGSVIYGNWEECRHQLLAAEPKDGVNIRMILTGWFRKKLLEEGCAPARAALLTEFIHELVDHNTPEVGLQLSAVAASIWKICARVNEVRAAGRTGPSLVNGQERAA